MFANLINKILGVEQGLSSNRQVNVTTPDVIEKSSTIAQSIPEKYQKDIKALRDRYRDIFKTGLCIDMSLQEALSIMPRERKRIDAFVGLISYLKKEWDITLTIKSQKTKSKEL